jgi:hypothetical protein
MKQETILKVEDYTERYCWLTGWIFLALILLTALILIAYPVSAAPIINPSVDSQPALCRNTITGWICDMQKPGPVGATGTGIMNQTPNQTPGPQGPVGVGGGQVLYFHHDAVPSPAGYEGLQIIPAGSPEEDETVSVTAAGGLKVFDPYITLAGYPGTTTWPAGLWRFRTFHYVDSTVGDSRIVFTLYNRTTSGTMTKLFDVMSEEINDVTATEHLTPYVQTLDYTVNSTDRMVINVSANTTAVAAKTVHFVYEGSLHTSHVQTPLPLAYTAPPMVNTSYVVAAGLNGGQTINGGLGANEDLILNGTSSATKTSSDVLIQPNGGRTAINGLAHPSYALNLTGDLLVQKYFIVQNSQTTDTAFDVYGIQDGLWNGIRFTNSNANTIDEGLRISLLGGSTTQSRMGSLWNSANTRNGTIFFDTRTDNALSEKARINDRGALLIGVTSSNLTTSGLDMTGTFRDRTCVGTPTFNVYGEMSCTSDEKLKENIVPATVGLKEILAITPIKYNFKPSASNSQQTVIGYSAQNVKSAGLTDSVLSKKNVIYQQVLKIKGKTSEEDVYEIIETPILTKGIQEEKLSIDQTGISAAQTNAIKELNAKIEAQQKQIDELKARLDKAGVK